jgi:hypothetical protein
MIAGVALQTCCGTNHVQRVVSITVRCNSQNAASGRSSDTRQTIRSRLVCRAADDEQQSQISTAQAPGAADIKTPVQHESPEASGNGNNGYSAVQPAVAATAVASSKEEKDAPKHKDWVPDPSSLAPMQFTPLTSSEQMWTKFKLLFALPWRRFKKEAVLAFKLDGAIPDQLQGRFAPGFSLPQICDALEKAAVDPRVLGIAVEISPLAVGTARHAWGRHLRDLTYSMRHCNDVVWQSSATEPPVAARLQ